MKNFNFKSLTSLSGILNIIGIAVAISAFYILMVSVDFDYNFNNQIKDYENIYCLVSNNESSNWINRPIGEAFINDIPSVENGGCLQPALGIETFYVKRSDEWNKIKGNFTMCSVSLLETFDAKFIEGSYDVLNNPTSIIITKSASQKKGLHVGDILKINLDIDFQLVVGGIIEDFPKNSEIGNFDGFLNILNRNIDDYSEWSFIYYLKLKDGIQNDKKSMDEILRNVTKKILEQNDDYKTPEEIESFLDNKNFSLVSLKDMHFHKEISGFHIKADSKTIYTLTIIAILILVIAYINYINFFFAQVPIRIKSINTRKVLGCSRLELIKGLIFESFIFTVISMLIAFVIIKLFGLTNLAEIMNRDLNFLSNTKITILTISVGILTAVISSIYPAFYITSISPALALRGSAVEFNNKGLLRYLLIGFQFVASICLIICSFFIHKNNDYFQNKDLGFNRENILTLNVGQKLYSNPETVREKLLQNSDIVDLSFASGNIVEKLRMGWGRDYNDKEIWFQCYIVDWHFVDFLGVEIKEGRNFRESDSQSENSHYIFNELAKKSYDLVLNTEIDSSEIIGFCNDFSYKPLQYKNEPFCFFVQGKNGISEGWKRDLPQLYIRTAKKANINEVVDYIQTKLLEIDPTYSVSDNEIITFNTEIAKNYTTERNLAKIISLFTFTAIIIAIIGLLGIVLFETQHRKKEIGVRKVNGATIFDILKLFNKKFFIIITVSFVLSIPISYFIVTKYFSGFADHCPIYWWIFAMGYIVALGLASIVVSITSIKSATENPVQTLRKE
ncbi:MAG: ABC transporter permease [Bacteroidales bacterium]|nr:ABC transporter permease [Bacteroidales bacterium]